ncbi:AMP-binding protein [Prochlorococcus sp. MIT 1223]|uniref:AMP-binding protein n=1 Tax=Prochlorococcus sp. MIT 1223 TaxID=3096217 RepID=UPI002A7498C1|nr:AMP-binding protein [Prochlorococcus sp. MIT 1223]
MKEIKYLRCDPYNATKCSKKLFQELKQGHWVELLNKQGEQRRLPVEKFPKGPGVIISSGGSTGTPHKCLHPSDHLNRSAIATAHWLKSQGIKPEESIIFNPLPLNHVSGLMPWWRSQFWETKHEWISPLLMKSPPLLEESFNSRFSDDQHPKLLSLVPLQLKRLLDKSAGIRWLKLFDVIWVGGSSLNEVLAEQARKAKIRLAPCYGATETMAMVTAVIPTSFLQGETGVGSPLVDVELRIASNQTLEIRTPRIANAIWTNGQLKNIKSSDGWWRSSDVAKVINKKGEERLIILGRLDNAVHSGSETIFPDKIEERLSDVAKKAHIPVELILVTSIADKEWEKRLIVLVRLKEDSNEKDSLRIFNELKSLVTSWQPAERPKDWYHCKELTIEMNGKWNFDKWITWVKNEKPIL